MNTPTRPARSIALLRPAPDLDPLDALDTASALLNSVHTLIRQAAIDADFGNPGQPSGGLWSRVSLLETIAILLEGTAGAQERRA